MIRIGILGTDNSHSITFSRLVNVKGEKAHVPGARVVAIFGLDPKRNEEVAEKGQVPAIVKRPREMLGMIDAAIVDFRHGGLHYKYARPFIEAGLPTFVDKPFSISVADAIKMIALAKRKKTPITSFSTIRLGPDIARMKRQVKSIGKVRGGIFGGPGSSKSEYAGVFFYGVHTVEVMLEVMGTAVTSVRASDHDGSVIAVVGYKGGAVATLNILDKAKIPFIGTVYGSEGVAKYEPTGGFDGYYYGMKLFLEMVRTRKPPIPYSNLLLTVKVMNAIQKSLDTGGSEVAVR